MEKNESEGGDIPGGVDHHKRERRVSDDPMLTSSGLIGDAQTGEPLSKMSPAFASRQYSGPAQVTPGHTYDFL